MQLINHAGTSAVFNFFASAASLAGLALTVCLLIKSSSMSNALKRIELSKKFNRERKLTADRFKGFVKSIANDGIATRALVHDISQEVQRFERKYKSILALSDIWNAHRTKRNLMSKKIDFDKLCHQLDRIVVKLNIEEE